MFKKTLFVFLLAAAVLAFAGYSVPTASACTGSSDDYDSCAAFQVNVPGNQFNIGSTASIPVTGADLSKTGSYMPSNYQGPNDFAGSQGKDLPDAQGEVRPLDQP